MGNAPVKIGVKLDEAAVEASEVLKGRVYLSIQGRPQRANGIRLFLTGEEIAEIVHEDKDSYDSHGQRRKEIDRATTTVAHMDVTLVEFDSGQIGHGQYEYPFEWPIPANLPSSMYCEDGESKCSIKYKLTAYLDNSGSLSDYSAFVDVNVAANSNVHQPSPAHMDLEEFNIKTCCADQGTMTFGWDADTIVAAPRHNINLSIMGKNDSLVEIQRLRACVVETVTWSANGRNKKAARTLVSTDIYPSENLLWKPLDRLPSRRERRRRRYESVESHANAAILENRCPAQLTIRGDANDTYTGSILQVRHTLIVSAITPNLCCTTAPESSVFMTIQRRMPKYATASATAQVMFEDEIVVATPSAPPGDGMHLEPPMAVAEILPDNWAPQESEIVVIPGHIVIPQASVLPPASSKTASTNHLLDMVPSAPQESLLRESHQIARSLAEFQSTLRSSKDPSGVLEEQLKNPSMVATIGNLSPHEFVETLKSSCRHEVDHARHARLLASAMVPHFYCRHVLACLWSLPQAVRFQVLKEVAPLASDLESQRSSVEQELDRTELMEFRAALS